jgi:hypothetical protein
LAVKTTSATPPLVLPARRHVPVSWVLLTSGNFEVGRPTGLRAGASQRFQLAGPAAPVLPAAGRYVVQCAVDGEVLGHTAIEVSAASPAASPE